VQSAVRPKLTDALGLSKRVRERSRIFCVRPGVGPALAIALVAGVGDPKAFRSGRDFRRGSGLSQAAFERRQGQARQRQQAGDRYLRSLFTAGALAVIRYAKIC
jgi:transposase